MKSKMYLTAFALIVSMGIGLAYGGNFQGKGNGQGRGNRGMIQNGNCQGTFVDEDGDGICDHWAEGTCQYFVDEDGDGICDNCNSENCLYFIDEDGNGICDHYENGTRPMQGRRGRFSQSQTDTNNTNTSPITSPRRGWRNR